MPDTLMRSHVLFRRNFAGYPFVSTMLAADKRSCAGRVEEALEGRGFTRLQLSDLNEDQLLALKERDLIDEDDLRQEEAAVFVSADYRLSVLCNVEDHVCIRAEATEEDVGGAIARAKDLVRLIHSHYPFASDERIGWLTARPLQAGTGLQVRHLLHLPMLSMMQQMRGIQAGFYKEHRFSLVPFDRKDPKNPSSLYWLSNLFTAYGSTDKLAAVVQAEADKLTAREQTLRGRILRRSIRSTYLDQVYRAYGILRYARRLQEGEFLAYWSRLRLGVTAGLIPLSLEKIDGLLEKTALSQLRGQENGPRDEHAIHFLRADKVRAELEGDI